MQIPILPCRLYPIEQKERSKPLIPCVNLWIAYM